MKIPNWLKPNRTDYRIRKSVRIKNSKEEQPSYYAQHRQIYWYVPGTWNFLGKSYNTQEEAIEYLEQFIANKKPVNKTIITTVYRV